MKYRLNADRGKTNQPGGIYRALGDKTQLGLWQSFHQIFPRTRHRDKFTRRQKWRHCSTTPTLTSFFIVSCSRSAFLIESCSSLSRVSKCLLWLFCVSISTSMSCCWFCRRQRIKWDEFPSRQLKVSIGHLCTQSLFWRIMERKGEWTFCSTVKCASTKSTWRSNPY